MIYKLKVESRKYFVRFKNMTYYPPNLHTCRIPVGWFSGSYITTKSCLALRYIQWNFNGSNTDGSFTTAVSNLIFSPWEKMPWLQIWDDLV